MRVALIRLAILDNAITVCKLIIYGTLGGFFCWHHDVFLFFSTGKELTKRLHFIFRFRDLLQNNFWCFLILKSLFLIIIHAITIGNLIYFVDLARFVRIVLTEQNATSLIDGVFKTFKTCVMFVSIFLKRVFFVNFLKRIFL